MKYLSEVKVMLEVEAEDRLAVAEKISAATFSISDKDINVSRVFKHSYVVEKPVSTK
jgi:hypothetical protein